MKQIWSNQSIYFGFYGYKIQAEMKRKTKRNEDMADFE